ncbi:ankyrin, partial [Massarina eburnea CBS 473.64]
IITLLHARGADIEARNVSGWTPLHNAAHYGLCEAVTALAKCGADVNALDWKGNPPIDKAIFYGHHEIVRYL